MKPFGVWDTKGVSWFEAHARMFVVAFCGLCLAWGSGLAGSAFAAEEMSIGGAGATFPMPVYSKWGNRYSQQTGVKITYKGVGSGGGISQIKAKTVDFGASDEPLKPEELEKSGLMQFPMVMGGVVPVVNIEGIRRGKLKLTPEILADLYMGKITKWNDRRIAAVNPNLELPPDDVTIVHRADGSGTTWIFTNYLTKVSPEFKEKIGMGKTVSWPTGVGGKGNDGVAALVKRTNGSIGYVEFAYALKERLKYVQLQNSTGKFVTPSLQSFQSACASADWAHAQGFFVVLTDQPGDKSWPIAGATYILLHQDQPDKAKAEAMLKFFSWCFKSGGSLASELHYVPIPDKVYSLVFEAWKKDVTSGGHAFWK
jgi:phosphate transport system substrate-binding protein